MNHFRMIRPKNVCCAENYFFLDAFSPFLLHKKAEIERKERESINTNFNATFDASIHSQSVQNVLSPNTLCVNRSHQRIQMCPLFIIVNFCALFVCTQNAATVQMVWKWISIVKLFNIVNEYISPFFAGFLDCLPFSLWKQVVIWQHLKCHILILALFKRFVWLYVFFNQVSTTSSKMPFVYFYFCFAYDFRLDEFLFMQIWHLIPKKMRCKWEKNEWNFSIFGPKTTIEKGVAVLFY